MSVTYIDFSNCLISAFCSIVPWASKIRAPTSEQRDLGRRDCPTTFAAQSQVGSRHQSINLAIIPQRICNRSRIPPAFSVEDQSISVLVIEAGEDRRDDSRVYTPGLLGKVYGDPDFDWDYASEPEPGLNNRSIKHPRGRVVGGTSAINSLALIYPSASGIDAWEGLGLEGWNWKTLAPYFRQFQTIIQPSQEVAKALNIAHNDESIRESNGPIQAAFPVKVNALRKAWDDTFRTLGLQNNSDPLDGHAIGGHTSACHITGDRRERSHAGNAYLTPQVLARSNLTLVTGAMVNKLLIDQSKDKPAVYGISYTRNGTVHEAIARKEVALAAGTFNSPQILQISGIGNPEILRQHDIDVVVANTAVGENLQDHIRPGISFEVTDEVPALVSMPVEEARTLYEDSRTGPWAEVGAFSFSYTPLIPFLTPDEVLHLEELVDKYLPAEDENVSHFQQKLNTFVRNAIFSPKEATAVSFLVRRPATPETEGKEFLSLNAMLSHPLSSGSTHIASSDPTTKPEIHFNYYSHPLDIEIHALHVKILERIAQTQPLASYIKPNGKRLPEYSDRKELCRSYASTNYHPCGTCSLGTVVDNRLRVKGVKGLRIVDASVIPIIPRGNIISTVYAIAERGADLISENLGIERWR